MNQRVVETILLFNPIWVLGYAQSSFAGKFFGVGGNCIRGLADRMLLDLSLCWSCSNLTASYVDFSDDDIRKVAKFYFEKESQRRTSARNTFFGKISAIRRGDVQAEIELTTVGGELVSILITNHSLGKLGVKTGSLITAEIKAPWVILQKRHEKPESTAENMFLGTVERINKGKVVTEYVVRIADNTEICSIVTSESGRKLDLKKNDPVWAMFNSFSVVLYVD